MEQLKEYLGTDLYETVVEALRGKGKDGKDLLLAIANDGSFLPKAKFDTLYKEYREMKEALAQKEEELAAFGAVQEEKADLEQRLAAAESRGKEEMLAMRKELAVEKALTASKAKNFKAVNALLDWEAISYEEGAFQGLEEQLTAVRESAPYLFEEAPGFAYAPKGGGSAPEYAAMSDAEYYRLMDKKG